MRLPLRGLVAVLAVAGSIVLASSGPALAQLPGGIGGIIIGPFTFPTTTTVSCTPAAVTVGGTSDCITTVSSIFGPSGSVSLSSDLAGATAPACSLSAPSGLASTCTSTVTFSSPGTHDISAAFGGGICSGGFLCLASTSIVPSTVVVSPGAVVAAASGPVDQISPLPPVVTALSTVSGTAGTPVTISGDHFESAKQVLFGDTPAQFQANGYKQISAIAPAGTGTVDVTVVNKNGTSEKTNADQFTYTSAARPAGTTDTGPNGSAGGSQATCDMPSLSGKTYRGAKAAMRAAGCTTVLHHSGHAKHGRSHVLSQTPAAATPLHAGDPVSIVLG